MVRSAPFERHTERYEQWFETHEPTYRSELAAVDELLPSTDHGLEIGVGSGRFAGQLGIRHGVDPAMAMLFRAQERGITVVRGVAEALPYRADRFDVAVVVTTICFVDDVTTTLEEARRVLEPGGQLVIGFVDRESPLGRRFETHREANPFYRVATFHSTAELVGDLESAGFVDLTFVQTVFGSPEDMTEPEPVHPGSGEGSFVVVAGTIPD